MKIKYLSVAVFVVFLLVTPLNADEADDVIATLKEAQSYGTAYEYLLEELTGKAGLFRAVPVIGNPVSNVLNTDENSTSLFLDFLKFEICLTNTAPTFYRRRLHDLTTNITALLPIAHSITLLNGPLIELEQGPFPTIINGLNELDYSQDVFQNVIPQSFPSCGPNDTIAIYLYIRNLTHQLDNLFGTAIRAYQGLIPVPTIQLK